MIDLFSAPRRRLAVAGLASAASLVAVTVSMFGSSPASANIGDAYVQMPGVRGDWRGEDYKGWMKIDAFYWRDGKSGQRIRQPRRRSRSGEYFTISIAPREGSHDLILSVDKNSKATLSAMMERCRTKAAIPELKFAENALTARVSTEMGPLPQGVPEFYEYKLSNVQIVDCPLNAEAAEQAFVIRFENIEWLNYKPEGPGFEHILQPAKLTLPEPRTGKTLAFVTSYVGLANDVRDEDCPVMNEKPPESEYYRLMSPEEAAAERAKNGDAGVSYVNGQFENRGPGRLNAVLLPGIVRDPGMAAPQTRIGMGLNLDGHDGTGKVPAGICPHKNYESADGRKGIDNQMFTVLGCTMGYRGHKGFQAQYDNEQRRNGALSIIFEISGIDDEQNDDDVLVSIVYSKDPMQKNADGSLILSNFTYRLSDQTEHTHFMSQLRGRIVDGVVMTEQVPDFRMHLGFSIPMLLKNAQLRLQIRKDGRLEGLIGGYEDWRAHISARQTSQNEQIFGVANPALYYALKRNADGLMDPVTKQCMGISAAYVVEGERAYTLPAPTNVARN